MSRAPKKAAGSEPQKIIAGLEAEIAPDIRPDYDKIVASGMRSAKTRRLCWMPNGLGAKSAAVVFQSCCRFASALRQARSSSRGTSRRS